MANKSNIYKIDDGTKEIVLQNEFGEEICKLHIRTGELGIIDRYNEVKASLGDILSPLQGSDIKNDGTSEDEAEWERIRSVENKLIEKINEIFDTKDAAKIFKTRRAFSTVRGKFFIENVLDVLGNIISDTVDEEAKLSAKRMDKYLKDVSTNDRTAPENA